MLFQDNRKLGKDSLKFAKQFAVEVKHEDQTTVGRKSDYYPMGYILKEHGMSVVDYENQEKALQACQYLVSKNQEQYGWREEDHPGCVDTDHYEFSRFWFVWSMGKTETNTATTSKSLEQQVNLDNVQKLEQAKIFMEGMGCPTDEESSSSVKIEAEKMQDLKKHAELLKKSYLMHTQGGVYTASSYTSGALLLRSFPLP